MKKFKQALKQEKNLKKRGEIEKLFEFSF